MANERLNPLGGGGGRYKIGGRNLLKFTQDLPIDGTGNHIPQGISCWAGNNRNLSNTIDGAKLEVMSSVHEGFILPLAEAGIIKEGDVLTASFIMQSNVSIDMTNIIMISTESANIGSIRYDSLSTQPAGNDWIRYIITFRIPEVSSIIASMMFYYHLMKPGEWFEIRRKTVKLERGDVCTDWTPAPEDVDARLAALESKGA